MQNYNNEAVTTFRGLPWFEMANNMYCTIGGAGGIGSWLALFLSRIGVNPTIYDFDYVEKRNMGGQFYKQEDIGLPKVQALSENIYSFVAHKYLNIYARRLTSGCSQSTMSFSAFDNMEARKTMFQNWKRDVSKMRLEEQYKAIFIDGRLEAEFFQIFCVTANRIEQYEATLFDDSELPDTTCTVKQTTHVAAMIGAYMTTLFTNHLTNITEKEKVREVPFKFEVFLPLITTYEE